MSIAARDEVNSVGGCHRALRILCGFHPVHSVETDADLPRRSPQVQGDLLRNGTILPFNSFFRQSYGHECGGKRHCRKCRRPTRRRLRNSTYLHGVQESICLCCSPDILTDITVSMEHDWFIDTGLLSHCVADCYAIEIKDVQPVAAEFQDPVGPG